MRFFIFQYLSGIGAFTSCGILNGKILRKENAASHKRDSNPTFISPCGYMHRNNSTPRFSRAESAGGRLPIVNQAVHHCACFFDHMIPFFTVFQHDVQLCTKSNKPLKPLDLRGFEDGSREVIWTPDQRLMSPLLYHWATLPLSGWCRKAGKYLTRIGKNVQIFLWIRSILSRQPAFPSREIITDEAFFIQPFHTACVPCRFLHAGIYGTGHYDAFCPMPLPQQDRK